ncbi:hypothetical protein PO647_24850, partial [Klebsiella pneumoniae]
TVCVVGKMRDLILQLSKSSIYSTKPGDGNNVFGEKMFRIENNYERRKEVRIPVKIWWVKVLFLGIMLTNQE